MTPETTRDRLPTLEFKFPRIAAALFALTFAVADDVEAQTAKQTLEELTRLHPSCEALLGSGNDVAACRAAFIEQGERINSFIRDKQGRGIELLSSRLRTKERCRLAVQVIDEKKQDLENIVAYLEGEAESGRNEEMRAKLDAYKAKLREKLGGKDPEPADIIADARSTLAQCGPLIHAALLLTAAPLQNMAEKSIPETMQSILDGVAETEDKERIKKAILAMMGMLDVLKAAAQQ